MNDVQWDKVVELLAVIAASLSAIASYLKASQSHKATNENSEALRTLAIQVNGRLTQLLERTTVAAHAEGVIEGAKATATLPLPNVETRAREIIEKVVADGSPKSTDTAVNDTTPK